jgi:hypothetical protein
MGDRVASVPYFLLLVCPVHRVWVAIGAEPSSLFPILQVPLEAPVFAFPNPRHPESDAALIRDFRQPCAPTGAVVFQAALDIVRIADVMLRSMSIRDWRGKVQFVHARDFQTEGFDSNHGGGPFARGAIRAPLR